MKSQSHRLFNELLFFCFFQTSFCYDVSPSSRQENRLLGGGRSGKNPTGQNSSVVGRLSSLTVPPPGWPWQGGMSQVPTDVSHTYSLPAAATESHTRISRQVMDAAGLQKEKISCSFRPGQCSSHERSLCAKAGPNRIFPLHANTYFVVVVLFYFGFVCLVWVFRCIG